MSRWRNWSTGTVQKMGFSNFLAESGTPMPGDPEEIAQQNGWTSKGYGWYQDSSGQIVARNIGGTMYQYDSPPSEADTQIDQGNPTPAGSAMKPADRARSMGLQSNGKGGYIDPKTGQVAARTVNNELVFYDGGPGGGAVSDGAGGQNIATSQPSWQDPETGLIIVPPAKPETPQELAAIPDPVPAQSPQSFNSFVQQKKLQVYAQNAQEREAESREQALKDRYDDSEQMHDVYFMITNAIKKAQESEDPIKMDAADRLKESLEEDADDIELIFQNIPDLNPKAVVSAMVIKARDEAIDATQPENEDEKDYDQMMEQGFKGGSGLATFIKQLRSNIEPQQQDNLPDQDRFEVEGVGGKVKFEILNDGLVEEDFYEDMGARTEQNRDLSSFQRNHFTPGNKVEVNWDVADGVEEGQGAAIDAMRTWKQKILPVLPVGSVVEAHPELGNQEQLTRLYMALGFGSYDNSITLTGIVTIGEDGEKYMQPIGEQDKMDRVREAYLPLVYQEINTEYQVFVEEMLFA